MNDRDKMVEIIEQFIVKHYTPTVTKVCVDQGFVTKLADALIAAGFGDVNNFILQCIAHAVDKFDIETPEEGLSLDDVHDKIKQQLTLKQHECEELKEKLADAEMGGTCGSCGVQLTIESYCSNC